MLATLPCCRIRPHSTPQSSAPSLLDERIIRGHGVAVLSSSVRLGGGMMYLADTELRALLAEMRFETAEAASRFDADLQVQPCSIDLRLDRVFWRARSGRTLDLSRSKLMELSPQMRWRRIVARSSEGVLLKPGEMILARTYEEFAIPNGFAGRIDGRSSFGRLGLLVHCTASLVNPGWRGRVPLELVNVSASPMRITDRKSKRLN